MAKSNMDQDILKVLLSEEEIKARVQEMGDQPVSYTHLTLPTKISV